tara:strand:- start:2760 stop:4022 length:1263 start_codon:yes stop_codon:yes gene_type:complete
MKIAYFDCFSGISGDMVLGALVDAGLCLETLIEELDKLEVPGLTLTQERTVRQAIAGTHVKVHLGGSYVEAENEHHFVPIAPHEQPSGALLRPPQAAYNQHEHHRLEDILSIIEKSRLDENVRTQSIAIFHRLAQAEAEVHGVPVDQVHLHEVGALDAVVDIVGCVAGLRLLGVEKIYASPLHFGTGFVRCAHGRYPIPVPGVLALCRDVPSVQTDIRSELVTPTGAALITTLTSQFGPAPSFVQTAVGYGAGSRNLEQIPNVLRVRLGEQEQPTQRETLYQIEANIDDMNPEVFGYLFERLFELGARDVYVTPITMKKSRPAHLLGILADRDRSEQIIEAILVETTTLGVRYHSVERRVLQRTIRQVETEYGPIGVKVGLVNNAQRIAPEYEDCVRLARHHDVPLLTIYQAASRAASEE